MTEDEMVGWHHKLNGHEFEQAPGVGDGQGSLTVQFHCCYDFNYCKYYTSHQRRQWHPTPVLLSGESQGRGSLVGCSPWGR